MGVGQYGMQSIGCIVKVSIDLNSSQSVCAVKHLSAIQKLGLARKENRELTLKFRMVSHSIYAALLNVNLSQRAPSHPILSSFRPTHTIHQPSIVSQTVDTHKCLDNDYIRVTTIQLVCFQRDARDRRQTFHLN